MVFKPARIDGWGIQYVQDDDSFLVRIFKTQVEAKQYADDECYILDGWEADSHGRLVRVLTTSDFELYIIPLYHVDEHGKRQHWQVANSYSATIRTEKANDILRA